MAETRLSTPAPSDQLPPTWRDLWESVRNTHPRIEPAIRHAVAAGVDPAEFCLLQLAAPKDRHHVMPRVWFGPDYRDPSCRVFSPTGEVVANRPASVPVSGTISGDGECHFDERLVG